MTTQQPARLAVVTGATGAVGSAISHHLASLGYDLLISARDNDQLETLAHEISSQTLRTISIDQGGLSGTTDIDRVLDRCKELGTPACFVNAAGTFGPIGHPESISRSDWFHVMALNCLAPIGIACGLIPGMLRQGSGRIVMVSSAHTMHPPDSITMPYLASKTALNAATQSLSARLAGTDVAAVSIHPGDLKTDMWADIKEKAGQLGPEATHLRDWAEEIGNSGGDDVADVATLVESIVKRDAAWSNGKFLFAGTSSDRHPTSPNTS